MKTNNIENYGQKTQKQNIKNKKYFKPNASKDKEQCKKQTVKSEKEQRKKIFKNKTERLRFCN